ENMLVDMVNKVKPKLPDHITLRYVKLQETATSYAEWFADEQ
ncbi:MAG: 6-pyruvoyltetrahydropterin/6-carboxytetrahydropterin synthase, partial [Arenicella sp.]